MPRAGFFAVLFALGGRLVLFVPAAGAGSRISPLHPSRLQPGGDVRAARRRVEDWHGAVASDTVRGSGLCTSGVIMSQGFPVSSLMD